MSKEQKQKVKSLKQNGLKENIDFRVVYFNTSAEIKLIKDKEMGL